MPQKIGRLGQWCRKSPRTVVRGLFFCALLGGLFVPKRLPRSRPNPELARLRDIEELPSWRRWGPYLADRQWGTVREDYSPDGNPWAYFPFAHAHRRAYRWGEDGIAGISDDGQR